MSTKEQIIEVLRKYLNSFLDIDGHLYRIVEDGGAIYLDDGMGGKIYPEWFAQNNWGVADVENLFPQAQTSTGALPVDMNLPGYAEYSVAEQDYLRAMVERNRALTEIDNAQLALDQTIANRDYAMSQNQFEYARQQDAIANQLQQQMFQWQQQLDMYDAQMQQAQLGLQQQQYGLNYADLDLQRQIAQQNAQLAQQQLAQQQYEFAAGLQQQPRNWIQVWQATRGMPFEAGGQSFQMPVVTQPTYTLPQVPAWNTQTQPSPIPVPTPVTTTPVTTTPVTTTPTPVASPGGISDLGKQSIDAARTTYQSYQQRDPTGKYPVWAEESMTAPVQPSNMPPIDIGVPQALGQYVDYQGVAGGEYIPEPQLHAMPGRTEAARQLKRAACARPRFRISARSSASVHTARIASAIASTS